jgi:small-conductance mechanosensitive channel
VISFIRGQGDAIFGDLLIIAAVFAAAVLVQALQTAWQRRKSGGFRLEMADFSSVRFLFILAPIAVFVVLVQNLFSWFGYATRDDVPYFLGLLAVLALLTFGLKWRADRKS